MYGEIRNRFDDLEKDDDLVLFFNAVLEKRDALEEQEKELREEEKELRKQEKDQEQ